MRYVLTASAREDLLEIWNYLSEKENFDLADNVRETILAQICKVAESPGIGHRRSDLTDKEVLFWRVFSYLVVYVPESAPLQVARILHGARDVQSLLDDR